MKDLNRVVANNLIKFRMLAGLTQKELAKMVNYSDKSISKWERGDGLPDLAVLVQLSEIYHVEITAFLNENTEDQKVELPQNYLNKKHILIAILSVGLVWFLSTIVFVTLFMIKSTEDFAWLAFIGAIPVSAILLLIFSEIWWNNFLNIIFSSLIIWGTIVFICLIYGISKLWILSAIGIALEILVIVWFIFKFRFRGKMNSKN